MTVQEIRDSFVMKYNFEAQKRQDPPFATSHITEAMVASWLAEGEMDIVRRIGTFYASQTITLVTGTTSYAINTNFGKPVRLFDGTTEYTEIPYEEFLTLASGDSNYYFAIEYIETSNLHINPSPTSSSVNPTLSYKIDTNYYSPAGDTDWKTTTTSIFSGEIEIPKRYANAIIRYMMKEVYPEFEGRYEKDVMSLRESQPFTKKIEWRLNGGVT